MLWDSIKCLYGRMCVHYIQVQLAEGTSTSKDFGIYRDPVATSQHRNVCYLVSLLRDYICRLSSWSSVSLSLHFQVSGIRSWESVFSSLSFLSRVHVWLLKWKEEDTAMLGAFCLPGQFLGEHPQWIHACTSWRHFKRPSLEAVPWRFTIFS